MYDYVYPCYKAATKKIIYLNVVHPMETHDSGVVNDNTGLVVGSDELDEYFNRRILPPKNPQPSARPQKRMIESQIQGLKARRYSKCGESGH